MSRIPGYLNEVNEIFESMFKEFCVSSSETHEPKMSDSSKAFTSSIDDSKHINVEKNKINNFLNTPCHCNKNCQAKFSFNELFGNRQRLAVMDRESRDFLILQQLRQFSTNDLISRSGRSISQRVRKKFNYQIGPERPVCRDTFLFYFNETAGGLQRIQGAINNFSVNCLIHGNKEKIPSNAIPARDISDAVTFIKNYAEIHGLPDPGRDVRKGKGKLRILLPSILNYQKIHSLYLESLNAFKRNPISYRSFIQQWQKECSNIQFQGPKTDLCFKCEEYKKNINKITAILDEKKEALLVKALEEAKDHLLLVHKERLFYKANIQIAKNHAENYRDQSEKNRKQKKSKSKAMMSHYSWDFAQQLSYPFEDQQVGPIYFKTPRKAQMFGVCNEGAGTQMNYLIDEAEFTEKNANTIISLLDHFFTHYSQGEKWVHLSADNCVGQNKNNALTQYLMYRILVGLHERIGLSFLIVGHTKFSPDGYFGVIKKHYRHSKVYSFDQLEKIVTSSTPSGANKVNTNGNEHPVVYRDWTAWLKNYFKSIKGITKYHHFNFDKTYGSKVMLSAVKGGQEIEIDMARKKFPFSKNNPPLKLPKKIIPEGLSLERQWYLYENIREHIHDPVDKDSTCPKPKIAKKPS